MANLLIRNVGKRFGAFQALKDVNIEIDDGEFLVLVGPSGCGKSTLLSLIAGLDLPSEGTFEIDGKVVNYLEPKDRDISMVFQSYALYPSMTVSGNIGFSLRMAGMPKAEREKRIQGVAELLQIEHLLNRRPAQLSGGQRQRVAMGRALVREPKLFLFDEPLSNLDAKLRVEMRTEIKKLHRRLKTTIVYVTHDQVEAMTLATRIAVMKDGEVQQVASPNEIYTRPANTFVATFMGSPAMNLAAARVEQASGRLMLSLQGLSGEAGQLPLPETVDRNRVRPGQAVLLGLRPEWLALPDSDTPADQPRRRFIVDVVEPTGPDLYADVHMGDHEMIARLPAGANLVPEREIELALDLGQAVLFDQESGLALTDGLVDQRHANAA